MLNFPNFPMIKKKRSNFKCCNCITSRLFSFSIPQQMFKLSLVAGTLSPTPHIFYQANLEK